MSRILIIAADVAGQQGTAGEVQMSAGMAPLMSSSSVVDTRHVERRRHQWTTREIALLKEAWPAGGMDAALAALPHRTAGGVYQMVTKLGLPRGPAAGRRNSWTSAPHIDHAIRRAYVEAAERNGRGAIKETARQIARPLWWVRKRAAELGIVVPRLRPEPWTLAEDQIIRTYAHLAPGGIARKLRAAGYARSPTACQVRLKRIGGSVKEARAEKGLMNGRQVAGLLGVDSKTVSSWLEQGLLTGKRRGTARDPDAPGGDEWVIRPKDVRRFVLEHVGRVDLRKVEVAGSKEWLIELLVYGDGKQALGAAE